MNKNILLAVVLLVSGLQMAAKSESLNELWKKGNFRGISRLNYSALTPDEQDRILHMAFKSNLPNDRYAARDLLNNRFKLSGQDWARLEKENLDNIRAFFASRIAGASMPTKAGAAVQQPAQLAIEYKPEQSKAQAIELSSATQKLIKEFLHLGKMVEGDDWYNENKNEVEKFYINQLTEGGYSEQDVLKDLKDAIRKYQAGESIVSKGPALPAKPETPAEIAKKPALPDRSEVIPARGAEKPVETAKGESLASSKQVADLIESIISFEQQIEGFDIVNVADRTRGLQTRSLEDLQKLEKEKEASIQELVKVLGKKVDELARLDVIREDKFAEGTPQFAAQVKKVAKELMSAYAQLAQDESSFVGYKRFITNFVDKEIADLEAELKKPEMPLLKTPGLLGE